MKLHEAIAVSYATSGQELSDAALKVMVKDLEPYPLEGVLHALGRCRKELRRICLADILDRIPGGHPGMEEAWAMLSHALGDERVTLVLTRPMHAAFLAADRLSRDAIAARMAFKEVYTRELGIAREQGKPVEWTVILGQDRAQRDEQITKAVSEGKILPKHAVTLLAHHEGPVSLAELAALAPPDVVNKLEQLLVKRIGQPA